MYRILFERPGYPPEDVTEKITAITFRYPDKMDPDMLDWLEQQLKINQTRWQTLLDSRPITYSSRFAVYSPPP